MNRAAGILGGVGLLALAFGVTFTMPTETQTQAPFAVTGEVGEQLVSGHLVLTVHEVTLAREAEVDTWVGTTSGLWLALDTTIEGRIDRTSVGANVYIDGIRYPASSRPDSLDGSVVDAAIPRSGPLLFELPAGILDAPGARDAVVRIGPGLDMRLDSVTELHFDLTTFEVQDRVALEAARDGLR
jgi:hypothetical protein